MGGWLTLAHLGATLLLLAWAGAAPARVVEEQFDLPVQVVDAYGKQTEQPIRVTLFRDDQRRGPQPLLVFNHGRAVDATDRAQMGRVRYSDASRWFVQQGFVVALPTRIGYGISGGPDVEDTGPCMRKNYPPGYEAAARQVVQVAQQLMARPELALSRWVSAGQSYGGAASMAVAAHMPAGLVVAINFAGGGGGNPKTQPGNPCAPASLESLFGTYGRTARVPTLWVYTENDLFLGAEGPRQWVAAYRRGGASAEFIQLPPQGEDGHALFVKFPQVWQPLVADFLRQHGLGAPATAPPAASSAASATP